MKRGKDDEKYAGPMFPRLSVNDKEIGGPRAPPRNKMALYEQLSIPSQRFNNTTSSFAPPPSNQGSGQDKGLIFPLHLPKSTPLADNSYAGSNRNAPSTQLAMKNNVDEEDYTVPIFFQAEGGVVHGKNPNDVDRENNPSPAPVYLSQSKNCMSSRDNDRKQNENAASFSRQESGRQNKENSKESLAVSCPEGMRNRDNPASNIDRHDEEAHESTQTGNGDRGDDDASETSMLDSISALDISPDDVVGVIGQKQFWKARKAIVHQQRAFAIQVFELHRLVKVQKSIACEPHLMLEDGDSLAGSSKVSSTKKLPLEYVVKPPSHIVKQKENLEEANNRLEQSSENAVAETSPTSVQNITQPSTNKHVSGNPSSVPEFNNGFQQAPGHQWLIPVMSPSEGLIYKPYPGHGFPGPFFGGVPQGANPIMGNFVNPGYNFMASQHHHQGNGFPTDPHQSGHHGYFSPYGMPVMNPNGQGGWISGSQGQQPGGSFMGSQGQTGPFMGSSHDQMGRFTGSESIPNRPQPSIGSVQTSKNGAIPDVAKVRTTYKENGLQGSTASSPGGEAQRPRESRSSGRRNALDLFPTSVADRVQEEQTRVIKVVPHNALSATESAARIFQSIQEGRKHHD